MSRRRFFVPAFDGLRAALTGEQAYHLSRVLRVRPGQLYELSDGKQLWLSRVSSLERGLVHFDLVEPLPIVEPFLAVLILLAIVKYDRLEWCLEKAAELGVAEILPVAARRSEARLVQAAAKRRPRWQKILLESAQQGRRLGVPALSESARFSRAVDVVRADLKIVFSESSEAPPLKTVLRSATNPHRVALAIGPEGGWTNEELRTAREHGFREASLGRSVLRTETAVIAALTAVNYELS